MILKDEKGEGRGGERGKFKKKVSDDKNGTVACRIEISNFKYSSEQILHHFLLLRTIFQIPGIREA